MATVADTSWLQALFDEGDVHHPQAVREAATSGGCVVPSEVLVEFLTLRKHRARMAGKQGQAEARHAFEGVLQAGFRLTPTEPTDAFLRFFRDHQALSFPDCAAAWQAKGGTLLTFDAAQRKAWQSLER